MNSELLTALKFLYDNPKWYLSVEKKYGYKDYSTANIRKSLLTKKHIKQVSSDTAKEMITKGLVARYVGARNYYSISRNGIKFLVKHKLITEGKK